MSAVPAVPQHLFTAIDHVGVAVADLDEAIAFYRDTYGMTLAHEEVNEEQGVREAMMAVGDSGSHIQLLAPLSPESPIARFLDRSGPGVQQVAYGVEDIDAVTAELRGKGVRLLYDEARRGTAGSRVNFVHPKDAMGVLVELVETAPASRGRRLCRHRPSLRLVADDGAAGVRPVVPAARAAGPALPPALGPHAVGGLTGGAGS